VAQTAKPALLLRLLREEGLGSVVAFTRTKHRANRLADYLVRNGVACARIHGNRSQSQRTLALAGFKRGEFQVLVATDIAARGIDVEALSHVVNFDVPNVAEDYVHRVGRTARAEATGDAITFVAPDEEANLRDIERALGTRIPREATGTLAPEPAPAPIAAVPAAPRVVNRVRRAPAPGGASPTRGRGRGPGAGRTSYSGGAVAAWTRSAGR
jgi:ATP-dependent RNA helicase RhlE